MTCQCDFCKFNNPKVTVTAIALRDNKLLVLKRNEEPFKDKWDLPGGYMNAGESPEECIRREFKEELNVGNVKLTYLRDIPSEAEFKGQTFAILAKFYLVSFEDEIKLNEENSKFTWVSLADLDPSQIAFDSNTKMAAWVKEKFTFDLARVAELLKQLDGSFEKLNEYAFYQSMLGGTRGYMEKVYDGDLLIGMGWIYPRQTALRHQAVVEDMIVDEKYRGKGFGDQLLSGLEKQMKDIGVDTIELTSGFHRKPAHALYARHNFVHHETAHMLKKI